MIFKLPFENYYIVSVLNTLYKAQKLQIMHTNSIEFEFKFINLIKSNSFKSTGIFIFSLVSIHTIIARS